MPVTSHQCDGPHEHVELRAVTVDVLADGFAVGVDVVQVSTERDLGIVARRATAGPSRERRPSLEAVLVFLDVDLGEGQRVRAIFFCTRL